MAQFDQIEGWGALNKSAFWAKAALSACLLENQSFFFFYAF